MLIFHLVLAERVAEDGKGGLVVDLADVCAEGEEVVCGHSVLQLEQPVVVSYLVLLSELLRNESTLHLVAVILPQLATLAGVELHVDTLLPPPEDVVGGSQHQVGRYQAP